MASSLFEHGAVRTTEAKAKEVRRFAEKLITLAKQGTLHARRQVISLLTDRKMGERLEWGVHDRRPKVIGKLFDEIAPKYADRPGGYTRIIRLAERRIGDAGVQVILQLVEEQDQPDTAAPASGGGRRKKRAAKRHAAAEQAAPTAAATAVQEAQESASQEEAEDSNAEAETSTDEESAGDSVSEDDERTDDEKAS